MWTRTLFTLPRWRWSSERWGARLRVPPPTGSGMCGPCRHQGELQWQDCRKRKRNKGMRYLKNNCCSHTYCKPYRKRQVIPQSHLLYGGRRTPKSSDSCGCRRNSAVAAGPPYGESLCFTGCRSGRRIIARSYNFFHFYVRRRNLTRRSHAPYGPLAYALIFVIKTTAAAGTPYGNCASSPQRT